MDKVKFALTFLVAAGIITGGYFFANNNSAIKEAIEKQTTGNKLGLDNPLQKGEVNGSASQGMNKAYVPTDAKGNITMMIAQSTFMKMRQLDQTGTNPFGSLDTSDPKTRAIIENTVSNVPEAIFQTAISTSELKTTSDNSRTAKVSYLEGIGVITKKYFYTGSSADRFKIGSMQELTNSIETDCFGGGSLTRSAELSKAYGEVFEEYKLLTVPTSWISMHKQILMHFKELSDIYGAFENCKVDPVRAYVGIDKLPEVYARTSDIQKLLNEKAIELGLE